MAIELKEEAFEFKKSRLLDVASELFFRNGFARTTLDDIAAELSVTKPFIYQFVENKADLLSQVCLRTTALAAEHALIALGQDDRPTVRLAHFVRSLVHEVIAGRMYLAVYFREEKHLPEPSRKKLADDHRHFNHALRSLLEQGKAQGEFVFSDSVVAMQAITGATTWIFNWYRPEERLGADEIARQFEDFVLRAVGAKPVS